jgi:hypothetical protein
MRDHDLLAAAHAPEQVAEQVSCITRVVLSHDLRVAWRGVAIWRGVATPPSDSAPHGEIVVANV